MAYEIFTRTRSTTTTPAISINIKGRVGLNRATTAILKANAVEFILLMWDADKHRMAFRPVVKKDSRAYGVSYIKSASMLTAKMFLEHIGYDYSESRSFPATWNESENMLEVDIPVENLKAQQKLAAVKDKPAMAARR
jgi:uncharacterized membrane-anchored protein